MQHPNTRLFSEDIQWVESLIEATDGHVYLNGNEGISVFCDSTEGNTVTPRTLITKYVMENL